ncbi:MAG: universal stress protein [Trebonia sp.]
MPGIVVGVDGPPNSERALDWAMNQAAAVHAALTVIAVHEVPKSYWGGIPVMGPADEPLLGKLRQAAEEMTRTAASRLGDAGPASVIVREVLLPVVEAQLDDDRSVDATNDELLKGSSLELEGSEDHQVEGTPAPVGDQIGLLPRPGLRPLLVDQLRLKTTPAYWIPAPEVLPFAEQLHEADVQRVLDAVDERLHPELVNQLCDGRFDGRHRFRDPAITLRRRRDDLADLAEQWLSVGGQGLVLVVQILILRSVVNHRPEYDSFLTDCQDCSAR